jgi:hypothetical protein
MALRLELLHECWDVLDTLVDLGPIRAFRCFPSRKFDAASRRGLYVAGGARSKSATALWSPILAILSNCKGGIPRTWKVICELSVTRQDRR